MSDVLATRAALADIAEQLGEPARDTILYEYFDKHLLEIDWILGRLPVAGAVLDIGGGVGVNLLCIRQLRPAARTVLVDRFAEYDESNRMGSAARARPILERSGVELDDRDFWPDSLLPYEEASFDVVTIFDVIEHLPGSPLPLLREIRRLLRPGGACILSGPNAASLMSRLKLLAGRHPHIDFAAWLADAYYSHYREFTRAEYAELLHRAGLRVERNRTTLGPWTTRARHRYYKRKRSFASPVTWGVYAVTAAELLLPPLRHSVYCLATRP